MLESARAEVFDAAVGGKPVAPVIRELARAGSAAPLYHTHTGFTTSSKAIFSGSLSGLPSFELVHPAQGARLPSRRRLRAESESFGGMAEALKMSESAVRFFDATRAPAERVFPSSAPTSLTLSDERVVREFGEISIGLD